MPRFLKRTESRTGAGAVPNVRAFARLLRLVRTTPSAVMSQAMTLDSWSRSVRNAIFISETHRSIPRRARYAVTSRGDRIVWTRNRSK